MNRKDKKIKELQEECKKRNISFLKSWSKKFFITRLEEEDSRDEEMREIYSSNKKEVSHLTKRPMDVYVSLQRQALIYADDYKACQIAVSDIQKQKESICRNRDDVGDNLKETLKQVTSLEKSGILGDVEFVEREVDVNGTIYTIKIIV
tara:strand:- start:36 stop:482 length:447 start_codon:yes stop_codon:yes gene_type:complete